MILLYQTHSPFARKVLVFAHEAGLAGQIDVRHQETSPVRANDLVFAANPLGKVPVLLREEQAPLFDSDVICAYLDTQHHGAPLFPSDGETRLLALRNQALAQGLADAGIAIRWEETRRPEHLRFPTLRDGYARKLVHAYDWLEHNVDFGGPPDIGQIALATALDWIQFRGLPDFMAGHPRLAEWFEQMQQRPSMQATQLAGDTHD